MFHSVIQRFSCAMALALIAAGTAYAQSVAELVEADVTVPMRDGVVLRADVLSPGPGVPDALR
jgi:predicted acyl esterase